MPAKIHRNVRMKVQAALFRAALEYLLSRADDHLAADPLLEGAPLVLAPRQSFWAVEKNVLGFSYVRALIRFSDRSQIEFAWRVHRNGLGLSTDGAGSLWTKNLPIDKYRKLIYPDRARGGAVVARGEATNRSTRTRPAIGRGFRQKRR